MAVSRAHGRTGSRAPAAACLLILAALAACDDPTGPSSSTVAVLSVVSGADQTDQVGAVLWDEVAVRAVDADGLAVVGVRVRAEASGDGEVDRSTARTDESGTATFRWLLGTGPGEQTLSFQVGDASARASALAVQNVPAFDSRIEAFRTEFGVPGLGVAVVRNGALVYARGYGFADTQTGEPVKAEHRFRIASVSKPITSAAVLQLVEDGVLDLDDPAFAYLAHLEPPPGATPDPRLADVTIRNLLEHSGGWDRDISPDPMFIPQITADAVGEPAPASAETVIRYMMGQPLDFDPGTRYAYSNFGYAVLGRIIEAVTGMTYEDYMTSVFLAPMGIERMAIGHTRRWDRQEQEVRYYEATGATALSVFGDGELVWEPYGSFYLEAMDSHGGWIASPVDLMRFVTSVDGWADRPDVIDGATIDEMIARPDLAYWEADPAWYAKGWAVRPSGGDANWWHDGLLAGNTAFLVRAYHGFSWVILANASAADFCCSMIRAMDELMWDAVGAVSEWPDVDLLDRFR